MKLPILMTLIAAAVGLQACDKPASMYADVPARMRPVDVPNAPAAYVGRWAVTSAACAAQPWTLTKNHLAAPDGTACDIVGVDVAPAGYSASSTCTGPALPKPKSGRIVMTMTGPAGGDSLSITDSPLGRGFALTRCAA